MFNASCGTPVTLTAPEKLTWITSASPLRYAPLGCCAVTPTTPIALATEKLFVTSLAAR